MWDWTASKKAPLIKEADDEEDDLLDEGQSPVYPPHYGFHKDPRIVPYKDPKEVSVAESADNTSIDSVSEKARNEALKYTASNNTKVSKQEQKQLLENMETMYSAPPVVPVYSEGAEVGLWEGEAGAESSAVGDVAFDSTDSASLAEVSVSKTDTGFAVGSEQNMPKSEGDFVTPSVVEVNDDAGIWEWQFSMFNLPSMSLMEVAYQPVDTNKKSEFRRALKRARRDFLRYIAYYNQAELESAGVDEKGIRNLKKGKAPENYDIHLKIPFEYGGTVEFSNLLFIQTHPFHDDIHKFLDMQMTSQPFGCKLSRLYIPYTEGRVYVPKDSSAIGGGKGKGDKTSVQGYSAAALQQMALKSTMDRGAGI